MVVRIVLPLLGVVLGVSGARGAEPDEAKIIRKLIDDLAEVSEPGMGYSGSVTGSAFFPLDEHGQFHAGLLGQPPNRRSEAMRELVERGAAAVPLLLDHLDDKRPTRIHPLTHQGGFGGMWFETGPCDYNAQTQKPPAGRKDEMGERPEREDGGGFHRITVGDLCYVAVGQIVNRNFNAVRYQPTAIIIVSSPPRSEALRAAVKEHWSGLTPEKHKTSLLADLARPDRGSRRTGAAKRLAYYYPDALVEPALRVIAQPTYDVFGVEKFVRGKLYAAKDSAARKTLFHDYLSGKHEVYREGVMRQLFDDLDTLEANEEGRLSPRLTEFADQPRKCLIELYGKPKTVKSTDAPRDPDILEGTAKARFISEGLIYDRSPKLDRAVRDLLVSLKDDDYLAKACADRLVGRGYDAEIEAYFRGRKDGRGTKEALARLGWTPVHVAVSRGNVETLAELLGKGANPGTPAKNGDTPLHLAVAHRDGRAVLALLNAKAAPGPTNVDGKTPVQLASDAELWEIATQLVAGGGNVPDVFVAAAVGNPDLVEQFVKTDADCATRKTRSETTPLHLAAGRGHAKAVTVLLAAKAAVDATGRHGQTPLHLACEGGHGEVVRALIGRGADVKKPVGKDGPLPLHLAAFSGNAELVDLLLTAGADVKAKANHGQTPLHFAAARGHTAVIELLVKRGAAVNAADDQNQTALHVAAGAGQVKAAELLLAAKANVGAEGNGNWTPLHYAVQRCDRDMAALLLRHKADPLADTVFGGTPLKMAEATDDKELIDLLRGAVKKK